MKKRLLVILAALSVVVFLGASAANAEWYTCEVTGTGTAASSVMVRLTHTPAAGDTSATVAFTNKWFTTNTANVTETNRILAALLTAMSLEKKVTISVAGITAPPTYPVIANFYLYK